MFSFHMHFYANFELGVLPSLNSTLKTFPTNSQITFLKTPKYMIIKLGKQWQQQEDHDDMQDHKISNIKKAMVATTSYKKKKTTMIMNMTIRLSR